MTNDKIYVIAEQINKNYYVALEELAREKKTTIKYSRFSKFLLIRNVFSSKKIHFEFAIVDLIILIYLLFFSKKGKTIIFSIAPFDYRLIFLNRLAYRHQVFYHHSWPYWDGSSYPRKKFAKRQLTQVSWKRFLERQVKGIFIGTEKAKTSLIENYQISVPISVVYHALPEYLVASYPTLRKDKIRFLFVGRLIKAKGLEILLKLIDQLPEDQFEFGFIGKGHYESTLIQIEKQRHNVKYYGFLEDKSELYRAMADYDFLLLPSLRKYNFEELFGIVLIEAMRLGVIPIATNHAGPSEIIQNGKNGFLIEDIQAEKDLFQIVSTLRESEKDMGYLQKNAIARSGDFLLSEIQKRWSLPFND